MEQKTSKTGAIVGTVVASLLCGCPGLAMCGVGVWALTGTMPYTTTVNGYSQYGTAPWWVGLIGLCASVLFVAVPVVVGVLTLRKKKPAAELISPDEPLPPVN